VITAIAITERGQHLAATLRTTSQLHAHIDDRRLAHPNCPMIVVFGTRVYRVAADTRLYSIARLTEDDE
jgi:hypothetical protein